MKDTFLKRNIERNAKRITYRVELSFSDGQLIKTKPDIASINAGKILK